MLSIIPLDTSVSSTLAKVSPFNASFKKPTSFPSKLSPSFDELPAAQASLHCWVVLCFKFSFIGVEQFSTFNLNSGICRASQVIDLFPTVSPEIIVLAETHCKCFFPEYSFPLDFVLRIDRLVVAISLDESFSFGSGGLKMGGFDGKFNLNKGYVAGILTVDNNADFLPRKGTGIAYISNVAVRENFQRKGIAKKLIAKAESHARSWG
ncbi:hypothetical protein AAZX31_16G140200 [Glycine max]|uniref:N-acetyltransferase domain-containing protein n=1 Tax=Glycine max TaxID=3847 RepID=K7MHK0_SOYBN|nr:hypothetical protein GLYMA_16G155400v4 [Glycine max]